MAYYALFHCLARSNADLLIGTAKASRSNPAWSQTYRALEHGIAKTACKRPEMTKFPADIQNFASRFVTLQELRHEADYDPDARFAKSGVRQHLADAEASIAGFMAASTNDRRAFAAWVLFKKR
ncbi:hypothetical protein AB6B38_01430 [Glycocaulis abyssi]|uniref:HEPN domain-containing protein n=1 Tax=Glycocaulis abyssi TaxID=1433403 RepID=A0ABV9NBQ1_9PROT